MASSKRPHFLHCHHIFLVHLILSYVVALVFTNDLTKCSTKWLSGYRLSSAQPQKTLLNLSLKECEEECVGWVGGVANGCAAFAFGTLPPFNNTCELAIAPLQSPRSSRSISQNITMSAVDKSPPWDVYVLSKDRDVCGKRSYLLDREQSITNVPIDCFYRLLSGKRLSKPHALKSISVSTLPECQDACIREASFQCRSVSYRYMPSGYSYSVSNCELSPFYIMSQSQSQSTQSHDFVDDFDYDYFQREPYCKTTAGSSSSGLSEYGVCAVVVRRGGRMAISLIKSSHQVTTPSQCEHLCTTSQFRCRAFAFRHTDRGHISSSSHRDRDPFHRTTNPLSPCQLYESELTRLPSYNIETDPDFDLYEMGRLMGAECMLQGQWGAGGSSGRDRYRPVTSTISSIGTGAVGDWYGQQHGRYPSGDSTSSRYPSGSYNDRDRYYPSGHYNTERYPATSGSYPSGGSGGYYDRPSDREGYYYDRPNIRPIPTQGSRLPGDRTNYFEMNKYPISTSDDNTNNRFPTPSSSGDKRFDTDRGGVYGEDANNRWNQKNPNQQQHQIEKPVIMHQYEKEPPVPMGLQSGSGGGSSSGSSSTGDTKGCLIRLRTRLDAYLVPEIARATFPVKTLEECSLECIRSMEVLRFPCRVMAFRFTSHSGGTCQLSATPGHTLRDQDFIMGQHGHGVRENGVVFVYDENVSGCQRQGYDQDNRRVDDWGSSGRYGQSSTGGSGWYGSHGQGGQRDREYYGNSNYGSSNYGSQYGGSSNYRPSNHGSDYGSSNYGGSSSYRPPYQSSAQSPYYPEDYRDRHHHNQPYSPPPNRHTVDGEQCLHSCVKNNDAGFYYCQTDREGAWNFCCRPDDGQCGYSRGLSFAWCYVGTGPSRDVWRTCKRTPIFGPPTTVQYLHDAKPPVVVRLQGELPLGNLTISDAVDLLERQDGQVKASDVVEIQSSVVGKNETVIEKKKN